MSKIKNKFALVILILLILQFILGMLSNLFQEIPQVEPWMVFKTFGYIMLHAYNGILLLIVASLYLRDSIRNKRHEVGMAVRGLICIITAFISGIYFVLSNQDLASLLMALTFIGAIIIYSYETFSSIERN